MPAAGATQKDTLAWLLESPRLLAAVALWVGGWLLVERVWYWRTGRAYSWRHVSWSLATGAVVGGSAMVVTALLQPLLWLVWPHRLWTLSMDSVWHWALAWTLTDFAYYWIHRALHVTRIGWLFHAPHHSARQVSLLDSLRSSWGEQPVGVLAFGVPLVLLGVPPYIAGFFYVFVAAFQFIVHTEMDWSLGPLDGILYTPASHRVHHSTDRAQSDMNYGGFFLVFDRIFGTWVPAKPSDRPVEYGLPGEQPTTLLGVMFGEAKRVLRGIGSTPGIAAKIRYALTRPAASTHSRRRAGRGWPPGRRPLDPS